MDSPPTRRARPTVLCRLHNSWSVQLEPRSNPKKSHKEEKIKEMQTRNNFLVGVALSTTRRVRKFTNHSAHSFNHETKKKRCFSYLAYFAHFGLWPQPTRQHQRVGKTVGADIRGQLIDFPPMQPLSFVAHHQVRSRTTGGIYFVLTFPCHPVMLYIYTVYSLYLTRSTELQSS